MGDQEERAKAVEQALLGFWCPRRMEMLAPHTQQRGHKDQWLKVGEDRVCSYCRSMHPEDLRAVLPSVDGEEVHLAVSDRRHKVYVRRPGIKNASEGAIKFYLAHGPPNADTGFWDQLNEKVQLCKRKFGEMVRGSQGG